MARLPLTLIFLLCPALISGSGLLKRSQPNYLINIGTANPSTFCEDWRTTAVSVAGSICHHHEEDCKVIGNGQAQAAAFYVPFIDNPPGHCDISKGPASHPQTDSTQWVCEWFGHGVHIERLISGTPEAQASPPALAAAAVVHSSARAPAVQHTTSVAHTLAPVSAAATRSVALPPSQAPANPASSPTVVEPVAAVSLSTPLAVVVTPSGSSSPLLTVSSTKAATSGASSTVVRLGLLISGLSIGLIQLG